MSPGGGRGGRAFGGVWWHGPIGPVRIVIGGLVLTALSAASLHQFGPGYGFPFFFLIPAFWLGVVVVAAILLRRGARRRWATYGGPAFGPHRSPEATLSERFANGEVDEVEYRSRLEVLRANRPQRR